MKIQMKTMALVGLMGSALLLTGCGGGGGGSSVMPERVLTGSIPLQFGYADTDGDGYISRAEATAAWGTATQKQREDLLTAIGVSAGAVAQFAALIPGDDYINRVTKDIVLTQVNGINGSGVNVGVIDDFQDLNDNNNNGKHGRHVAGIVQAIAPGASIASVNVFTGDTTDSTTVFAAINSNVADIYNLSLGGYGETTFVDTGDLTQDDKLFIVAAGNDALDEYGNVDKDCSVLSKCNSTAVQIIGEGASTIVVGSINNSGNTMHGYSTEAGKLKDHYLVAPVILDADGNPGTSYAAPVVSGVAALLMDNMNNTDASLIRTRILTAADELDGDGVPNINGVDAVFGHGRLNVGRSLAPVGGLR